MPDPKPTPEVPNPDIQPEESDSTVQPSRTGFENLQKDDCAVKDFLVAAPYCPTCTPDESAIEDDWKDPEYEELVFLDKRTCEYTAVVEVNFEEIFDTKEIVDVEAKRKEKYDQYLQELIETTMSEEGIANIPENKMEDLEAQAQRLADDYITNEYDVEFFDLAAAPEDALETFGNQPRRFKFDSLLTWARDPVRVRHGIRQLLDETGKQNSDGTVCAFGGCVASAADLEKNKKAIQTYAMKLHRAEKSLFAGMAQGPPEVWQQFLVGAVGGIPMLVAGTLGTVGAKLWDLGNAMFGNEEEKRELERMNAQITTYLGSDILTTLQRLESKYGQINPYALEWVARVPEDGVYMLPNSKIIRYVVKVAAFNLDLLPDSKDEDDDDEKDPDGEIEIENAEWATEYQTLWTGLTLLNWDYDIFRINDHGSIVFDKEGATSFDTFEFGPVIQALKSFKVELAKLLNKNRWSFSYQKSILSNPLSFWEHWTNQTVESVRIEIARKKVGDIEKLQIQNVYVTAQSCPEVKLTSKNLVSFSEKDSTLGKTKTETDPEDSPGPLSNEDSKVVYKKAKYLKRFKNRVNNETLLYFLSKKGTVLMTMEAEEKKPIYEWAKEFVYPPIKIDLGLTTKGETEADQSTLGCVLDSFPLMSSQSWGEILDGLVVGTWDVFKDKLRKEMCKDESLQKDPGLVRWAMSAEAQDQYYKWYEAIKAELRQKRKEEMLNIRNPDGSKKTDDEYVSDIKLSSEEELDKWMESEGADEAEMILKESKAGKAKLKELREAHPYSEDIKSAIWEQFDYENSLIKIFADYMTGDHPSRPEDPKEGVIAFLSSIGLCGMMMGLKKVAECLMGQIDLESMLGILLKKTLGRLSIEKFIHFVTEWLPIEKQIEISDKVNKKLENFFEGAIVDADAFLNPANWNKNPKKKSIKPSALAAEKATAEESTTSAEGTKAQPRGYSPSDDPDFKPHPTYVDGEEQGGAWKYRLTDDGDIKILKPKSNRTTITMPEKGPDGKYKNEKAYTSYMAIMNKVFKGPGNIPHKANAIAWEEAMRAYLSPAQFANDFPEQKPLSGESKPSAAPPSQEHHPDVIQYAKENNIDLTETPPEPDEEVDTASWYDENKGKPKEWYDEKVKEGKEWYDENKGKTISIEPELGEIVADGAEKIGDAAKWVGEKTKIGPAISQTAGKAKAKLSQFLTDRKNNKFKKLASEYEDWKEEERLKKTINKEMGRLVGGKAFAAEDAKKELDVLEKKDPKDWEKDKAKLKKMQDKMAAKAELDKVKKELGNPKQASVGKAAAEITGIVLEAYVEAILDALNTSTMMALLKQLPGIDAVPDFVIDFFTCPKKPIIDPPIKEMLDFNFKSPDWCDPTNPIIDFTIPSLGDFANPWGLLMDALIAAFWEVVASILVKIAVQFLIELESALCKALGALGKAGLDTVTGNYDKNPLLEAFRDGFCGPETPKTKAKAAMAGAMQKAGITNKAQAKETAEKVAMAMSSQYTKGEVMRMFFLPMENPDLMKRVVRSIRRNAPEMVPFFGTPEQCAHVFQQMANILPLDHKNSIRAAMGMEPPDSFETEPFFDTICLTSNELEQWNNLRASNLESDGLPRGVAEKVVGDWNRRTMEAFEDALEDPNEQVQNALMMMLSPPPGRDEWGDPDPSAEKDKCDKDLKKSRLNSKVDMPGEIVSMSNASLDRIWEVFAQQFSEGLAGSPWGGAILSNILSDTTGQNYVMHNFFRRFFLTKYAIWDSEEQIENTGLHFDLLWHVPDSGFFPKTVNLHLFQELQQEFEYKLSPLGNITPSEDVKVTWEEPPGKVESLVMNLDVPALEESEYSMTYQCPPIQTDPETGEYKDGNFPVQAVEYVSQVQVPEFRENLDYKIIVKDKLNPFIRNPSYATGFLSNYPLIVSMNVDEDTDALLSGVQAVEGERYRITALNHVLTKAISKHFDYIDVKVSDTTYESTIDKFFTIVRDICLDIIPRDNQLEPLTVATVDEKGQLDGGSQSVTVPDGFAFGYLEEDVYGEYIEYVGPEGEEYNYDEEEQVLGKMKKHNPRVHILDPKKYGGTYGAPPWYVEDRRYRGWLGIARAIAPSMTGCKPAEENILQPTAIKRHAKNAKNKAKVNEKIFEGRGDCFYHIPFDRLIGREGKGMIEGCVKAAIRINVIEQLILAIPVLSFVEYNSNNFDNSFGMMIAKRIQQDLAVTDGGWFPRKIEKTNYWLAFLEQAVQMYWRMYDSGDIEEIPPRIEEIYTKIRELQEDYTWKPDMWWGCRKYEGIDSEDALIGRKNRKISLPGHYIDFKTGKKNRGKMISVPVYEYSEPIEASWDEWYSGITDDGTVGRRKTYEKAAELGGIYPENPIDTPNENSNFFKIDKVIKEYEKKPDRKEKWSYTKPRPASQMEWDSAMTNSGTSGRRSTLRELKSKGGVYETMSGITNEAGVQNMEEMQASVQFGGEKYLKVDKILEGYIPAKRMQSTFNFKKQYAHYCALAYQTYGDAIFYSDEELEFGDFWGSPSNSNWQYASCLFAVRSMQEECIEVLAELINMEIKDVFERFNKMWKPEMLHIGQYLLTSEMFEDSELKNIGTRTYEEKLQEGAITDIGTVSHVVSDSSEDIFSSTNKKPIRFKIEKYIRIIEKPDANLPEPFANRDNTLKGVVNLETFQTFIDSTKEEYGEYYLSDLFGTAEKMYSFEFVEIFEILSQRRQELYPQANPEEDEKAKDFADKMDSNHPRQIEEEEGFAKERGIPKTLPTDMPTPWIFETIEEYTIAFSEAQMGAFKRRSLKDVDADGKEIEVEYGTVMLPHAFIDQDWFKDAIQGIVEIQDTAPTEYRGEQGLRYGIRIVVNLPAGTTELKGFKPPTSKESEITSLEKCFYVGDGSAQSFSFPLASTEIDVIDSKVENFNWKIEGGDGLYPFDLDCLLRQIVKTPEYRAVFNYISNPRCVTSMCAILSNISFDSGIGFKDGWVRWRSIEGKNSDGDDETFEGSAGAEDAWDRAHFRDAKKFLRKMFSGFYLANDFESPEVDLFEFSNILKIIGGGVQTWLKQMGGQVSWWWRRNFRPNPFDANGEECKSEYDKLFD